MLQFAALIATFQIFTIILNISNLVLQSFTSGYHIAIDTRPPWALILAQHNPAFVTSCVCILKQSFFNLFWGGSNVYSNASTFATEITPKWMYVALLSFTLFSLFYLI